MPPVAVYESKAKFVVDIILLAPLYIVCVRKMRYSALATFEFRTMPKMRRAESAEQQIQIKIITHNGPTMTV